MQLSLVVYWEQSLFLDEIDFVVYTSIVFAHLR